MAAKKDYKTMVLDPKYRPKATEKYMSDKQKAYFYQLLLRQKQEIEDEADAENGGLALGQKLDSAGAMDEGDAATLAIDADMSIKLQERSNTVIKQIDTALDRLKDGTYGYSLISGDKIGIKRLMIRPIATMTIEEKESAEK